MEVSRGQMYIERLEGSSPTCVRLESVPGYATRSAGAETSINAIIVEVGEATPATGFWGTVAACHRFEVIVRRLG